MLCSKLESAARIYESKTVLEEIKKHYDQEWVELIDYDWPEDAVEPRSGIVRVHAKTKAEFDDLAEINPPKDSAYVFVGRSRASGEAVITRGYSRVIPGPEHA